MPQKKFFRQRAHCNPLAHNGTFDYPRTPEDFDWGGHYPSFINDGEREEEKGDDVGRLEDASSHGKKRSADGSVKLDHAVNITKDGVEYHSRGGEVEEEKDGYKRVEMMDIGCGYGGLTVSLAPLFPSTLILAVEIRDKVTKYVHQRILHLREANPGQYGNISVMRGNTMQHLVHYIAKGQLTKIFICFPDPHFKKKNHRRRIVR